MTVEYRRLKWKFVRELGGLCVGCGCRQWEVLTFHHLRNKRFNISDGMRALVDGAKNAPAQDELKAEVAKTVLLCPTCHALVNEGLLDVRADGYCKRIAL